MTPLTFVETLKREVGRMQAMHPEREGELSRACALVLQGMVTPSADDPATAHVLSSDGATHYTVNGSCSCQAGQHGKGCKHMQAWKLYRYIAGKVDPAPAAPAVPAALPEAPASANVRLQIAGREVQWTLRDADEDRLAHRLEALLARYPVQAPASTPGGPTQGQGDTPQCPQHGFLRRGKRSWYCPVRLPDDTYCTHTVKA